MDDKTKIISDRDQISCSQDHELEYVLKKYGKRTTTSNVDAMRKVCQQFKASSDVDDRKHFYEYLEKNNVLKSLE